MLIKWKINKVESGISLLMIIPCVYYIIARSDKNVEQMFACGFAALIIIIVANIKNYKRNIAYILFVLSCFLFMQGMYFVNILMTGRMESGFSVDISVHINDCIFLSIIFLNLGYLIGNSIYLANSSIKVSDVDFSRKERLREVALKLSYISGIVYIAELIDVVIFVRSNSYLDYYLSYSTHLPRLLQVFGHMYIAFIWIYFATAPKKRDCTKPIIIYLIISVMILLTGDRGGFIQSIGILIVYAFWRQERDGEVWIKRIYIVLGLIALPFFLAFMSFYVHIREGIDVGDATVLYQLQRFVSRAGNSAGVIGYGKIYHDQFPQHLYSMGGLIDYIKYNPITQVLFGVVKPQAQTADYALNMHSFESALSYFVFPTSYANGHGIGSSYVAEAYHDFGYMGVILFNIIYGFVLSKCNRFQGRNPLNFAILLLAIRAMFYAPRGPAIVPITSVLNITIISAFLLIYFASRIKN